MFALYFDGILSKLVLAPEYGGDGVRSHYRNGVFIAFHGSWDRAPYTQGGYNVVFQALAGDHAAGRCEIFADGFAGAVMAPTAGVPEPKKYRSPMPPMGGSQLTPEQVSALAAYVWALSHR